MTDLRRILRVLPWYGFGIFFLLAFLHRDAYAMAFNGTWLLVMSAHGYPNLAKVDAADTLKHLFRRERV